MHYYNNTVCIIIFYNNNSLTKIYLYLYTVHCAAQAIIIFASQAITFCAAQAIIFCEVQAIYSVCHRPLYSVRHRTIYSVMYRPFYSVSLIGTAANNITAQTINTTLWLKYTNIYSPATHYPLPHTLYPSLI